MACNMVVLRSKDITVGCGALKYQFANANKQHLLQ